MKSSDKMFCLLLLLILPICNAENSPNILFILADDVGYNDVSWHNNEIISPNLDKLAKDGIILESHYTQPICTPTRSALLTSYYPIHTGRQHKVLSQQEPKGLFTNFTLMPEYFKEIGYKTHMIGKWHLGFCNKNYIPTQRGFDTFYGFYSGNEDYYGHFKKSTAGVKFYGYDFRNQEDTDYNANGTYSSGLFADRAVELMKDHVENTPNQPMFLYLPFQNVHVPLQVPKEYEDMYPEIENENRRLVSGMVTAMDDAIGVITQGLKNLGMMENTIIVFTSDNGGNTLQGGNNYPLRGNKNTLWEGGVKTPSFVHYPPLMNSGTINNEIIHVTDWIPTLLTAVKDTLGERGKEVVNQFLSAGWDGIDQWETIINNSPSKRTEFLYNIDPLFDKVQNEPLGHGALRMGDMKLIVGHPGMPDGHIKPDEEIKDEHVSTRGVDLKEQNFMDGKEFENKKIYLYNITDDPFEYNNIAEENPEIVDKMMEKLMEYWVTMIPADVAKDVEEGNPVHFNGTFSPGFCASEPY